MEAEGGRKMRLSPSVHLKFTDLAVKVDDKYILKNITGEVSDQVYDQSISFWRNYLDLSRDLSTFFSIGFFKFQIFIYIYVFLLVLIVSWEF